MPDELMIRTPYRARLQPEYFDDVEKGILYQPEVYTDAARVATATRASRIIDVGCGDGTKISGLAPQFPVIGIDYGPNLELCRRNYPSLDWREHDLLSATKLPVEPGEIDGAVIVCADVIEHLITPLPLFEKLRFALAEGACAVLLSTPERELTFGFSEVGPPLNRCHVREWTIRELGSLLRVNGLGTVTMGLTRSSDRANLPRTILAVITQSWDRLSLVEGTLIDHPTPIVNEEPPALLGPVEQHQLWRRVRRAAKLVLTGQ